MDVSYFEFLKAWEFQANVSAAVLRATLFAIYFYVASLIQESDMSLEYLTSRALTMVVTIRITNDSPPALRVASEPVSTFFEGSISFLKRSSDEGLCVAQSMLLTLSEVPFLDAHSEDPKQLQRHKPNKEKPEP